MHREQMLGKLKKYRWPVYGIIVLSYMLGPFFRGAPTIMGPELINDLNLDAAQFGLVGLSFFWAYALANAPAGAIVDRYGSRQSLIINLAITVIGCFIFSYAQTFSMLIIGRMVCAFALAGIFICGVKTVTVWFTTKQFPQYYSIWMALGMVGGIFATSPLQIMMTSFGWRTSMSIIGWACVAVLILAFLFMKSRPADVGLPTPDEIAGGGAADKDDNSSSVSKVSWLASVKELVRMPVFVAVSLFLWSSSAAGQVVVALWGGMFLAAYGLDKSAISQILTICAVFMVVGCVLAGWINKTLGPGKVMLSSMAIYLIAWFYASIKIQSLNILQLQIFFAVIGFVLTYSAVAGFTAIRQTVPASLVGTAVGLANSFLWIFGVGGCQQVWGVIIKNFSQGVTPYPIEAFEVAMWFQFITLIIGFISAAWLSAKLGRAATAVK